MNYQRIFENALRKLNLSKKDVKDWKPAGDTYVPEIGEIKDAIVIWTNDGREILYREKVTKRLIEVYQHETIGSLIRRLLPNGYAEAARKDSVQYSIPLSVWTSRIPEEAMLPEGGDLG